MKHSGVDALGPVPSHWEVAKLGHIGRLFKGNGASKEDEMPTGIPCIRYGDLYTRHRYFIHDSRACISEERASDYTRIEFGDILFAASGETIDEIGKSAVNLIEGRAYCGGDVIVFRPKRRLDCGYMGYATDFQPAVIQKARMGRGFTVVHIYGDQLKKLAVPLPPIQEQTDIARFLDHINQRIHRYIRAKEKLVALLKEQKQAVIHNAITGKVNVRTGKQYRAYRDAGLEDVGAIPNHWRVVPLKRVLSRIVDCEHKTAPKVDESDYFVIRTTAVRNGTLLWNGAYCTDSDSFKEWTRRSVPRYGEVIFTREAPAGEACVVPRGKRVCLGQRTVLLRPEQERYDPHYLVHMIYEGPPKSRIQLAAQGSTVGHFNVDDIGSMPVLLPTLDEQTRIVEYLESVTSRIDAACSRLDRGAQVLRELRTRLIADVVTGKLDAREAAKKLPEVDIDDVERDDNRPHGGRKGEFDELASIMTESAV